MSQSVELLLGPSIEYARTGSSLVPMLGSLPVVQKYWPLAHRQLQQIICLVMHQSHQDHIHSIEPQSLCHSDLPPSRLLSRAWKSFAGVHHAAINFFSLVLVGTGSSVGKKAYGSRVQRGCRTLLTLTFFLVL